MSTVDKWDFMKLNASAKLENNQPGEEEAYRMGILASYTSDKVLQFRIQKEFRKQSVQK